MTLYYIIDTNFFIDLVNLRARSVVTAIKDVFARHNMVGVVTTHILEEVRDRIMRGKIEQSFKVIPSPAPQDALFAELNEYGSMRKVLNQAHPLKYFKREFDPDIELIWVSLQIQQGKLLPSPGAPPECIIVTDDEGVENFHRDYCAARFEGDAARCQVIKPYIFLQRVLPLAATTHAREALKQAENAVFQQRIDFKKSMGRTQDLVKTIYQMRREVIHNLSQLQGSPARGDPLWPAADRQVLEEILESEEKLLSAEQDQFLKRYEGTRPIVLALRELTMSFREWNSALPVPEGIYQAYYRLLFELNAYKNAARAASTTVASYAAQFFYLSLVVDAKVFDIFLQVNAAFLREAKLAQSIETMNMLGGHISGLQAEATLAFHALLAFLWLAKGEAGRARSILTSTPPAALGAPVAGKLLEENPTDQDIFSNTLALLKLLDGNFASVDEVEKHLAKTLDAKNACTSGDYSAPEYQECSRALQNLSETLSSLGSPFAEKLLYLTAVANKLCCVPPEEFSRAAEKYLEAARVAQVPVRTPEVFAGVSPPDLTDQPMPPDLLTSANIPVDQAGKGTYAKHFHVIQMHSSRTGFELLCWFEPLQARVLLLLPRAPQVDPLMVSPHKIRLISGDVQTSVQKSLLFTHHVRVVVQASPNVQLEVINRPS